jgi:hypothetical protein
VDIVQAAGRALRLSPGKKFGYILIPLIIPENENATEAAKDKAFEEIVATIRALATQDTRIIEYLRAVSSGTIPKGGSPVDGITKINVLTKVNEEEFNKSIQLKVWDRVAFGNWRPYEEAKKYVQKLFLRTLVDWQKFSISKNRPRDIPTNPQNLYKKNWKSWGEFLGTNTIANNLKKFRSYNNAKKYAQSFKFKNTQEWRKHTKSKNFPTDIPKAVENVYKKNWEGMGTFLGTGFINSQKRKFKTFIQAKKYARLNNIKSMNEWRKHAKYKNLPKDIPTNPWLTYKNEWKGMGDFLGTGVVAPQLRKYMSFEEARSYARSLKIKTAKQWYVFSKLKKYPNDLPKDPYDVYINKGWKSWGDFLGTGSVANYYKKYLKYKEAKFFVKKLNLKNQKEWFKYSKSRKFPSFLPATPMQVYKNSGWIGLDDFLGTGRKPRSKKP